MIPPPNFIHTGQIIVITKMLAKTGVAFYEFIDSKPVLKGKSETANPK